ncbi:potassium channel subfamily K member 3 [Engraulis encrasicolus]|uniref:potassium channel subfamily K member 3 n=1 Tax=Engraulis encrasicolus TaxID=184585 RepID=UPI002FD2DDA1
MTAPCTVCGKIFLIPYGLLGCAATILFFNLFLERAITLISAVMYRCHQRRRQQEKKKQDKKNKQHYNEDDEEAGEKQWRPSVYHVTLVLGALALLVACAASGLYSAVEGWSYFESLYFCFVTFSTMGFGDMVSGQRDWYLARYCYQVANSLVILVGVCCTYSLFNITSVIVKQGLNWTLARMLSLWRRCHSSSSSRGCGGCIRGGGCGAEGGRGGGGGERWDDDRVLCLWRWCHSSSRGCGGCARGSGGGGGGGGGREGESWDDDQVPPPAPQGVVFCCCCCCCYPAVAVPVPGAHHTGGGGGSTTRHYEASHLRTQLRLTATRHGRSRRWSFSVVRFASSSSSSSPAPSRGKCWCSSAEVETVCAARGFSRRNSLPEGVGAVAMLSHRLQETRTNT